MNGRELVIIEKRKIANDHHIHGTYQYVLNSLCSVIVRCLYISILLFPDLSLYTLHRQKYVDTCSTLQYVPISNPLTLPCCFLTIFVPVFPGRLCFWFRSTTMCICPVHPFGHESTVLVRSGIYAWYEFGVTFHADHSRSTWTLENHVSPPRHHRQFCAGMWWPSVCIFRTVDLKACTCVKRGNKYTQLVKPEHNVGSFQ